MIASAVPPPAISSSVSFYPSVSSPIRVFWFLFFLFSFSFCFPYSFSTFLFFRFFFFCFFFFFLFFFSFFFFFFLFLSCYCNEYDGAIEISIWTFRLVVITFLVYILVGPTWQ